MSSCDDVVVVGGGAAGMSAAKICHGWEAAGNLVAPMAQVINSAAAGAVADASVLMDEVAEDVTVAVAERGRRSGSRWPKGDATLGRAGEYWDHREARMVRRPVSGARDPAALAAARRSEDAEDAEAFWEPHYASRPASPHAAIPGANAVLVDVAGALVPGTALDLGSGEGGDACWLARHGWDVTTVDVSTTALQRVAAHATKAGLSERVHTRKHDLSLSFPTGSYQLISAQYFQSPIAMDRPAVLARAASAVREGGMLLIVDHASVAPWSWADPDAVFPTPERTLDELRLDLADWEVAICENRDREATGPDGERATVIDTVIALVRREGGRP